MVKYEHKCMPTPISPPPHIHNEHKSTTYRHRHRHRYRTRYRTRYRHRYRTRYRLRHRLRYRSRYRLRHANSAHTYFDLTRHVISKSQEPGELPRKRRKRITYYILTATNVHIRQLYSSDLNSARARRAPRKKAKTDNVRNFNDNKYTYSTRILVQINSIGSFLSTRYQ